MFQVGDRVKLNGCPFDAQIPEEALLFTFLVTQTMTVTRISKPWNLDVPWTGKIESKGRWIKTDLTPDWIDQEWFKKAED